MLPRHTKQIRTGLSLRDAGGVGACAPYARLANVLQLANGVRDVGRGFAALRRHPRLWRYVLAPALISLVVFVALIAAVLAVAHPVVDWATAALPARFAHLAGSVMTAVVGVVLSVGTLFLFVSIAGMISGPFNEALSEHLEHALTGRPAAAFSLLGFLHGLTLSILHGVRRLLGSLFALAMVFVIGLVPVIGTAAAIALGAWITANAAAYDCYDAVFGRRTMRYRAKLAYLRRHRGRTVGLGGAVAGMMLVPGLNLIALGLGSAGATVAALELDEAAASSVPPASQVRRAARR